MADKILDCKEQNCPIPIMNISKTARTMQPGQTLEVCSTDLAFPQNVEAWCRMTGHILERLTQNEGVATAVIKLKSGD